MKDASLIDSPLGKNIAYQTQYDPTLLFAVPRERQRRDIGIDNSSLPFQGIDIWNAYEISWLDMKGKPQIAIGEFFVPCTSPYIVESKSLKLYLTSFYQTPISNIDEVRAILKKDLSNCVQQDVVVKLTQPSDYASIAYSNFPGTCLDELDIQTNIYTVDPNLLKCGLVNVEEKLYSHLLKSNCLGTRQPDWASLYIHYIGPQIDHASLLQYIISFRMHNEFGEHCIERIFMDLLKYCQCKKLTVYGRYTRRGGIDLNPFRSNFEEPLENTRDYRQ
jgi:7-cyano-7-deazaguanine reductase